MRLSARPPLKASAKRAASTPPRAAPTSTSPCASPPPTRPLARRYADDHPLTLDLDLDLVRALLGSWLAHWSVPVLITTPLPYV